MEVLSSPNCLQTQPVWDSLHNPQLSDSELCSMAAVQADTQWSKPSTLLPVLQTRGDKRSRMEALTSVLQGLHSKPTTSGRSQLRKPPEMHRAKLSSEKAQAKIRFLGTRINILEWSNQKELQQLTQELKEWEEKEESKMKDLEQQVEQLNAKIEKTHKEVSFLSTYMDHEYPVKAVQIANLVRELQQMKDAQQNELDDLNEMCRMVLEYLSEQILKTQKNLLRSLVVKSQKPHQEALLQKIREGQQMLRHIDKLREFISQFEKEIPILKAEVEQLQVQVQEPREIVFADVLLRRPKCTPDMDVTLNIPVEEPLPF
ncbi:uncharacterized protein C20orf96 homolog isoform X4 [Suricata suricatta]|uniref:uncharacterized protein C20orf96 homolog isoform X4 n=1 Tax=Suricata suricatta TaxID=37032 RepID=UPI001155303B|nr:uncharacterized protein C20orf96 homolog isoform X4 [Suricata suricatta]